ncbi:hypothetical protein C3L33_10094, partial [Rhododendron williamsianum]
MRWQRIRKRAVQLLQQLDLFQDYKSRLVMGIGENKAKNQIEQAIFYVNAGSDDFAFTYFHDGIGQKNKTEPRDLQRLLEQGARKIAVNGLPPLGCIPVGITLLPQPAKNIEDKARTCIGYVNAISLDFNSCSRKSWRIAESTSNKIVYIDFVEPLLDVIQNPHEYGYTEANKGCCGTGLSKLAHNATQQLRFVLIPTSAYSGMQHTQLRRHIISFSEAILQPLMTSLGANF